jgi:hypothetical protein
VEKLKELKEDVDKMKKGQEALKDIVAQRIVHEPYRRFKASGKSAYVTLAFFRDGLSDWDIARYRDGIDTMVKSLKFFQSKYPLLLLTNKPSFFSSFGKNVTVRNMTEFTLPCNKLWAHSFQKLQIFNLTEYDKLLWLDADVEIRANVDYIFQHDLGLDGKTIYAQADEWECKAKLVPGAPFCSGVLLFRPSQHILNWCMNELYSRDVCPPGDQNLMGDYFVGHNYSINLFPNQTVVFGHCEANYSNAHMLHKAR